MRTIELTPQEMSVLAAVTGVTKQPEHHVLYEALTRYLEDVEDEADVRMHIQGKNPVYYTTEEVLQAIEHKQLPSDTRH
jgi:hypothetical protein